MKLEINDIKTFQNIIDIVSSLVTDVFFIRATPEHLVIDKINAYRVAMINVTIDSKFFEAYEIDKEVILPLNFTEFSNMLKMFRGFKKLRLEFDEENNSLNFYAAEGRRRKRTSMQLDAEEPEEQKSINVKYNTMISIKSDELANAMKEATYFDRDVHILTSPTDLIVKSRSDDKNSKFEAGWKIGQDIQALMSDNLELEFPIDFVEPVLSTGKKLAKEVMISLGEGVPMRISFNFEFVNIVFFIVPNDRG